MKLIKTVLAGLLLSLGGICLVAAAYSPFDHETRQEERSSQAIACLLFGLPITGVGGWIAWSLHQQNQKEARLLLQSTFYRLLKENHGHITVLSLAMEAKITASLAKQYLDELAKEFDATFDVSQEGVIYYYFASEQFNFLPIADSPNVAITENIQKSNDNN